MKDLFKSHIEHKISYIKNLLDKTGYTSLVIDNGQPEYYFHDDQTVPHKPNPHFVHICPDKGEGHVLQISASGKPRLYYYSPNDFWHDISVFKEDFWTSEFDVQIFNSQEELWRSISVTGKDICLTPRPDFAKPFSFAPVDPSFLSALNWLRIEKSEYEIHCIKEANKIAALGHLAAKDSFFAGKSEHEVFQDYLRASQQLQLDLPYGNIIAFNEKAAILHYQNTLHKKGGKTFLIDAGATYNSYCSDITRTYFCNDVHDSFKSIHNDLDKAQKELCLMVKPGFDYQKIQDKAHELIANILINNDVLIECDLNKALDLDLISTFFPHGIGHALGIQVHDVGGKQLNEQGTPSPKSSKHPYLRTLREIQDNDVMTIEPGIYFIPMLLQELKEDAETKSSINWSLINELIPLGGFRIEDNIVARKDGPENLTRPFLPN